MMETPQSYFKATSKLNNFIYKQKAGSCIFPGESAILLKNDLDRRFLPNDVRELDSHTSRLLYADPDRLFSYSLARRLLDDLSSPTIIVDDLVKTGEKLIRLYEIISSLGIVVIIVALASATNFEKIKIITNNQQVINFLEERHPENPPRFFPNL